MSAIWIGKAASHSVANHSEAKVIGRTSRGTFLAIDQRVLFISFEHWRGPLTINVDRSFECAIGDRVQLSPTRLIFPAIEIDLSAADVWQPAAPSSACSIAEQREALRQLASSVLTRKSQDVIPRSAATRNLDLNRMNKPADLEIPRSARNDTYPSENGLGLLLPYLLDLPEKQALSPSDAALLARLAQLRDFIQQGDFAQAILLIEGLVGLGRGLTPSGDDVIIGLLLRLNHGRLKSPAATLREIVLKRVVELAYQRTTTISANLIECAANGEADERLLNVVNGLVVGTPSIEECVNCVLGWGNSSGIDALVGMTLLAAS